MKRTFTGIAALFFYVTFAQTTNIEVIETQVSAIEANSNLKEIQVDLSTLTNISTDGGGVITLWQTENEISKIVEEVGLSRGTHKVTIYLSNGLPIKIIECESTFSFENGELNYSKLEERFKATIYSIDWLTDTSQIHRKGIKSMSNGGFSSMDYQPIIDRAKQALKQ